MLLNNAYIVEPYPIVEAGIIILAAVFLASGLGVARRDDVRDVRASVRGGEVRLHAVQFS